MKIICEVNSLKEAKEFAKLESVDVILINLDFLSLEQSLVMDDNKALKLIKYIQKTNKAVGINIDRLFHQDDIGFVSQLLDSFPVDYVVYSDLGIYHLLSQNGITDCAIYRAPTYLTNYYDINIFQKLNEYVVASNQISVDELVEIVENTNSNLVIDGVGMACCFYSKRYLVTNYLKFKGFKLKNYRNEIFKLKEETRDNFYHLVEDVNGTKIYDEAHYALTVELELLNKAEYFLINRFNFSDSIYKSLVKYYNDYFTNKISANELDLLVNNLNTPFYKGAYGKKTVLLKEDCNE